jgi:hypothetical protein
MLCKAVAILLAGSWLFLSVIDTLEDFAFPGEIKLHAGKRNDFTGFGRAGKAVYNLVQHGGRRIVAADASAITPMLSAGPVSDDLGGQQIRRKPPPVLNHKLHNVLII